MYLQSVASCCCCELIRLDEASQPRATKLKRPLSLFPCQIMEATEFAGSVIGAVDGVVARTISALCRLQDRWRVADLTLTQLIGVFESCAGFGLKLDLLQKRMTTRISVIGKESWRIDSMLQDVDVIQ